MLNVRVGSHGIDVTLQEMGRNWSILEEVSAWSVLRHEEETGVLGERWRDSGSSSHTGGRRKWLEKASLVNNVMCYGWLWKNKNCLIIRSDFGKNLWLLRQVFWLKRRYKSQLTGGAKLDGDGWVVGLTLNVLLAPTAFELLLFLVLLVQLTFVRLQVWVLNPNYLWMNPAWPCNSSACMTLIKTLNL